MGWQDKRRDFCTCVIHGDIIEVRPASFLFAVQGEPDETIWIPQSVIVDGMIEESEDIDLEVEQWWYREHEEKFE